MAKARKKTTTSKNTQRKTVDNSIIRHIHKAFEEIGGKRVWGMVFVIKRYTLDKDLVCPVITAYDPLFESMDHEKIKQVGINGIINNMLNYFNDAIENTNYEFSGEEFWKEHSSMVTNFTFPLTLLDDDVIAAELENNDDRFYISYIEYCEDGSAKYGLKMLDNRAQFTTAIISGTNQVGSSNPKLLRTTNGFNPTNQTYEEI